MISPKIMLASLMNPLQNGFLTKLHVKFSFFNCCSVLVFISCILFKQCLVFFAYMSWAIFWHADKHLLSKNSVQVKTSFLLIERFFSPTTPYTTLKSNLSVVLIPLIVPTLLRGRNYILKWVFFVPWIFADRYIHRRELRLVSLESSSSVEYEIKKVF